MSHPLCISSEISSCAIGGSPAFMRSTAIDMAADRSTIMLSSARATSLLNRRRALGLGVISIIVSFLLMVLWKLSLARSARRRLLAASTGERLCGYGAASDPHKVVKLVGWRVLVHSCTCLGNAVRDRRQCIDQEAV